MKAIINGISLDTVTAKLIGSGDHEWSNAGWHLYETPNGGFFKVIYGYDGEEIGVRLGPD